MEFLRWIADHAELLSALIALIAFFRPEISAIVQNKQSMVDFHPRPSQKFIIGFRACPQCWLDGTIESVSSNNLISDMIITIKRNRDNSTHSFQWVFWESTTIGDQRGSPAYAFQLFQNGTMNGLFSFRDIGTEEIYSSDLNAVRDQFNSYLLRQNSENRSDNLASEFGRFSEEEGYSNIEQLVRKIQRSNYFEAGTYKASLNIQSKRPMKSYKFDFEFSLSQAEHQQLEANALRTVMEGCGVRGMTFYQTGVTIENFTSHT